LDISYNVDAREQFLSNLKGIVDPKKKWKIIRVEIIAAFDEYSHQLEKERSKRSLRSLCRELYSQMLLSHVFFLEVGNRTPIQSKVITILVAGPRIRN